MSKVPLNLEGPVEQVCLHITNSIMGFMHDIGFTPNLITTLSLIFGLASIRAFINESYILSGFLFMIGYLFDTMDGHMARTYKQTSPMGAYYDQIKDTVIIFAVMYLMYIKYSTDQKLKTQLILFPIILLVLTFTMHTYLDCKNKYYSLEKSGDVSSLNKTADICKPNDKQGLYDWLNMYKWGSDGTFNLAIAFMMAYPILI
jgi:phosphatidylglycerophosphate synthase